MRLVLLVACMALASVALVQSAPVSSSNTNLQVPTNIVRTQCSISNDKLINVPISTANNNQCTTPLFYISNACDESSAIFDFPANRFFPGTSTLIPQYQWVCAIPTAAQAGKHTCMSSIAGVCPQFPQGNTGVTTDRWAVPRPLLGAAQYPVLSTGAVGAFPNFPLAGADGTYIFTATITQLTSRTGTSTTHGTAQFDIACRQAGPANSRAIICADGTNQNFYSAPLQYGFSPASRSATTFMTYGRGAAVGKIGGSATLVNGQMNNANPAVYAAYQAFAIANNLPTATPQKVLQPVKPVFAFDPYAKPTPGFVQIADSVDDFVREGIDRAGLIADNQAALAGQPQSTLDVATLRTFRAFYKGSQVFHNAGGFFGGAKGATFAPADTTAGNDEIATGYQRTSAWTGCFGTGDYLPTETVAAGTPIFDQFPLTSVPGFQDARYASSAPEFGRASAAGLSFPARYTCNDWTDATNLFDPLNSYTPSGVTGNAGKTFYTNGNPDTAFFVNAGAVNANQPFVTQWLADQQSPASCTTQDQAVYCSWYPTNTDGVQNGDETGVDCGGTTLGADNQGLPTQNCGCTAGYFYDYTNALCIPCIQDTYCNNPTGCVNECYPCFTAPTSGAALKNGAALFPNHYANPQPNNLNSLNQQPGSGPITPQAEGSDAQQFNTNGNNVILVGTTFNQLNQQYDFAATQCYCNIGFSAATNTATTPGHSLKPSDLDSKFVDLPQWLPFTGGQGFKAANGAAGPFDGSNCVPVVRGDPQITGLQGQDFQVHGIPDEFFNMISHPDLQVNSHFVFLEDARCDNFTTCFSHAGTYIDQIGMQVSGSKIKVFAGALEDGLQVWVDDQEIKVGEKIQLETARIYFSHPRKVHIRTALFSFAFVASDLFMNQEIALLDGKLAKLGSKVVHLKEGQRRPHSEIPLHGIVGQTWQNLRYPENMMIEGAVADYRIEESELFGNTFAFNKFGQQ